MSLVQSASVSPSHAEERDESRDSMVVPKLKADVSNDVGPEAAAELSAYSWALLRPSSRVSRDRALLHEAYRCWREVWSATFAELNGAERLFSDDFARQQEFVTLFEAGRCIGMVGLRHLDLATQIACDDSYFKIWPEQLIARSRSVSRVICVLNNLTVHPDKRGANGFMSVKEILTVLTLNRFASSTSGTAVVCTRNNRGVGDLMYRYGASCLLSNATLHGVSVDLVEFSRWSVRAALAAPRPACVIRQLCGGSEDRRSA